MRPLAIAQQECIHTNCVTMLSMLLLEKKLQAIESECTVWGCLDGQIL